MGGHDTASKAPGVGQLYLTSSVMKETNRVAAFRVERRSPSCTGGPAPTKHLGIVYERAVESLSQAARLTSSKGASMPTITRRSVVKGVSWSAPVVAAAAAAPAFAVSCGSPLTYTGKFTQASSSTIPRSYTYSAPGGASVVLSVATSAYGGKVLAANNLTAAGNSSAGYNGLGNLLQVDGLLLQQAGAGGQKLTITLSKPVTDLAFTIADIDWNGSNYQDSVWVSPSPTSVSLGTAVTGKASQSSPLKALKTGSVLSSASANWASVTMAGPVSSFTVDFSSTTGNVAQQIFLTGLSFKAC